MMQIKLVLFSLCFAACTSITAQLKFDNIRYEDHVYFDYIKSVEFSHRSVDVTLPIVDLGSNGRLMLKFDDREGGFKSYHYRIIHCDKDWNRSSIQEIEYMEGFNDEEIDEFQYSTNAYSDYTHYSLVLPNEDFTWTVSGNYLLMIYDDDMEELVLTRRFMVAENEVGFSVDFKKPSNVIKMNTHQEFKLAVNYQEFRIAQPMQELYVTVLQNGNWTTRMKNLKGVFERGKSLIFDKYDYLNFPALKEFRSFDIRSLNYVNEYINSVERGRDQSTVLLNLGERRSDRNFLFEFDTNGFFVIGNDDAPEADISAEYAEVIFNLQAPLQVDKDYYIIGKFSDWKAKEEYKLEFDASKNLYIGSAYFKQGYYDYMFATVDYDNMVSIEEAEGNWFETENDYQILVYYREFGSDFDRLIGVATVNSNPKK